MSAPRRQPRKLVRGDRVAIVSPSFAAPALFPEVHEVAMATLIRELGLVPVEYPTTRQYQASAEARARDLNDAFADASIRGAGGLGEGRRAGRATMYEERRVDRASRSTRAPLLGCVRASLGDRALHRAGPSLRRRERVRTHGRSSSNSPRAPQTVAHGRDEPAVAHPTDQSSPERRSRWSLDQPRVQ